MLESDLCLRLDSSQPSRLNLPHGTFPPTTTVLRGHFSRLHNCCEPVRIDMPISLDSSNEAGSLIAYANASQGKRRKIERPDKQDVSKAVNGLSKEERRLAKKARKATGRAETKDDKADMTGKSRYTFNLSILGPCSGYAQTDLQRPMPRKLPGGPRRGSMAKLMTLPRNCRTVSMK